MIKPCETCSKDNISKMIVRGVYVKKFERLKFENLHPCLTKASTCNFTTQDKIG